jgi:hypothetical protein
MGRVGGMPQRCYYVSHFHSSTSFGAGYAQVASVLSVGCLEMSLLAPVLLLGHLVAQGLVCEITQHSSQQPAERAHRHKREYCTGLFIGKKGTFPIGGPFEQGSAAAVIHQSSISIFQQRKKRRRKCSSIRGGAKTNHLSPSFISSSPCLTFACILFASCVSRRAGKGKERKRQIIAS